MNALLDRHCQSFGEEVTDAQMHYFALADFALADDATEDFSNVLVNCHLLCRKARVTFKTRKAAMTCILTGLRQHVVAANRGSLSTCQQQHCRKTCT